MAEIRMTAAREKLDRFPAGALLMQEGEPGDCAFIITEGEVEILVTRNGQALQLGTRGPGAILGEMAMIDDKPRTATVRALGDVTAQKITRTDFARSIEEADPSIRTILHALLSRYHDTLSRTQSLTAAASALGLHEHVSASTSAQALAINTVKTSLELREALAKNQLCLFYQPIIDLQNMKLAGFEALMRWQHPEKGMISPGAFIPVAEETGLIVDMSHFALDTSCDAVRKIRSEVREDITPQSPFFISVNFSVKDFSTGEFFQRIESTLQRHRTAPANIHLEITESLLMDSPDMAKAALEKCRQNGISVSIDDFGSGYSSLSYLHAFPIDTLKIDQSFIRSMRQSASSLVLVKSIIGLARNLSMKIVAEGIETQEEARVIRDLGCHLGQGYWFGKPMPIEDAITFARTWQPPSLWD